LRRLLDFNDQKDFTGPPENIRETAVAAAKALSSGNWETTEKLLLGLACWSQLANADSIKAMLKRKIQEEGLRTYLFVTSRYYDSVSLGTLAEMFELPKNIVHSIVSKMMIPEELHASWDQPTESIIMHKVEPTRLQYLAVQFSEKVAVVVESNERLLDTRTGGYGYGPRENQNKSAGGKENWQQRGDSHDKRKPYRKQAGYNRYDNQRSGERRGDHQQDHQKRGDHQQDHQKRGVHQQDHQKRGDHQQDHQKRGEYQRNQRPRNTTGFRNF